MSVVSTQPTQAGVIARQEKVVELLAKPMTLHQLAAELGVSYHTARNDVFSLRDRSLVREATQIIDGKRTYVSGGKRPMPVFVVPTGQGTMLDIIEYFGKTDALMPVQMTRNVYAMLLQLADIARVDPPIVTHKQLAEMRAIITKCKAAAEQTLAIAEGMLNNENLWDPSLLTTITADEAWNENLVEQVRQLWIEREEKWNAFYESYNQP